MSGREGRRREIVSGKMERRWWRRWGREDGRSMRRVCMVQSSISDSFTAMYDHCRISYETKEGYSSCLRASSVSQPACRFLRSHARVCRVLGVWLNGVRQRILEFQQINTP